MKPEYTYRILPPEEWSKVEEYMASYNQPAPSSSIAVAAVAEDALGNIQGVLFMQLQWHLEPLILNHASVRYDKLFQTVRNAFTEFPETRFYCYTNTELVSKMAASMGLNELGKAWKGEF